MEKGRMTMRYCLDDEKGHVWRYVVDGKQMLKLRRVTIEELFFVLFSDVKKKCKIINQLK